MVPASRPAAMRIFGFIDRLSCVTSSAWGVGRRALRMIVSGMSMSGHVGRRRRRARRDLGGRRRRGRQRLPQREPHGGDLLLLTNDDFLGDAPKLLILAVAQLCERHVDRALMMPD